MPMTGSFLLHLCGGHAFCQFRIRHCNCIRHLQSFRDLDQIEFLIPLAQLHLTVNVLLFPPLALVNIVRFMIQGMGYSVFAIFAGIMEMVARGAAGLLLVPHLGFLGACLGSPLAWILADVFLIPAYFRCRRLLMTRVHHIHPRA
jgi:Na+-driven multidrug efflux pump